MVGSSTRCRFRHLLVLVILIAWCRATVVEYTFQQERDHFNPEDSTTFTQYYWVNNESYQTGGPVLVYLSNLVQPTSDLQESAVSDWARSLGGFQVELEVRYSGNSVPSVNFTSSTFRYQTPEQNLADLISFRAAFTQQFPALDTAPWILIGEYLNANYATWAREKYPNVILGAVSVSGPVEARSDFPEYFQYWATIAGDECARNLHAGVEGTEMLLEADPGQAEAIKALFGCDDVPDDTQFFYVLAQLTQFGLSTQRDFVCRSMNTTAVVDAYATLIQSLLQSSGLPDCAAWNLAGDKTPDQTYRPTFYLSCGYLGQFETAGPSSDTTIVSNRLTVNWYLSICENLFQAYLIPKTTQTNVVYGAKNPWGSNYAFVSTASDPFRSLVINETSLPYSSDIHVITAQSIFSFIAGTEPTENVQEGREKVLQLMQTWLAQSGSSPISLSPSPSPTRSGNTGSPPPASAPGIGWQPWLYLAAGLLCLFILLGFAAYLGVQYAYGRVEENRL